MDIKSELLKPFGYLRGGVEPGHHKATAECETVKMSAPKTVVLPMLQHIGAPCSPLVKPGDEVFVGTKIGDSEKLISAPIHSSVSGKVKSVKEFALAQGVNMMAVEIESDGLMAPDPEIKPPVIEDEKSLVEAVREMGLVGLGGAGFPAHVKLMKNPDKPLDTLIINGAECEPFITADYRECLENTDDIVSGVYLLLKLMKFERVIIAIEDNKPKAIEKLLKISSDSEDKENRVRVMKMRTHYPQGAEKALIYTATGRKLGVGKLPADVGCVVVNITSVSAIGKYLKTGMPLVSKRLTIDGDLVNEPKNVLVPLGSSISDVLEFAGGIKADPYKLIIGGPMMGLAIENTAAPIVKQNNAVLALSEKTAYMPEAEACIRCGKCATACPMHLVPFHIAGAVNHGDSDEIKNLYADYCMECGCCAFSCPSKRPLVETMRRAKAILREKK